ncbi:MAG: polysaccharide deacetylase [Hespellia sp.]|nr:polysaccharide deacetylase [Hespellia sp.]
MEQKKRMSRRRRQAIRKRRILIGVIVLVVAAVIVGAVLLLKQAKKKTTTKEASSKTVQNLNIDNAEQQTKAEGTDNADAKKEDAPDRSGFAVDPNVPAGSDKANEEKTVYMTFDDGPSYNTQAVLDILDKYDAKATFFVTGINPDYFDMIKTAYDKGHTIGLHTYSHDYANVYASQDAYFSDLDQIGQVVKDQIGYVPCFIRFPGGSSNTISANYTQGIMTALSQEVQARGYQYYDWNISCGDGGDNPADVLRDQAISVDYSNIVLLMHDANNKETTVQALPEIIEHYKNLGYQFKAIDRDTFDAHHGIGN